MSTDDSHTISGGDRKFLDASVVALHTYKHELEAAINFLANHSSDASASMMAECLKTVDGLNTTMTLHREVRACTCPGLWTCCMLPGNRHMTSVLGFSLDI